MREHISAVRCKKCHADKGLRVHFVSRYEAPIRGVANGKVQYGYKGGSSFLPELIVCSTCGHSTKIPESVRHAFVEDYAEKRADFDRSADGLPRKESF